jgi:hypothetical protein
MTLPIIDGTGKGFLTRVDEQNRLRTYSITEASYDHAASKGLSFNINTEFIAITSSLETPILYLKNNNTADASLVNFFIGTGLAAGTQTEHGLIRAYFNPVGVSGGTAVQSTNRDASSAQVFDFTILKHTGSSPILATYNTITPVLYQTQPPATRVFGQVYLVLPQSKSVLVTYTPNGAQNINIYAGFGGYLDNNDD